MKKVTIFLIILFLSPFSVFSQKWLQMIRNPNTNFYDIQKAFYDYQKEKVENKEEKHLEKGAKTEEETEESSDLQFKRWEWFMEPRVYPSGNRSLLQKGITNYKTYLDSIQQTRAVASGNWSFVGPASAPSNYGGTGRINCIRFDPTNSNIMYVGSPDGGLWKSINGGQSWTMWNTDNILSLGVSDIAIDPTNTQIMYISTGDKDAYDSKSIGVLKSIDGGVTWNSTGLNWTTSQFSVITRLLIDPTNTQIIHAATNFGLYRTTNGGTTWTLTLNAFVYSMEFKPGDPTTIYAAGSTSVYKSTNSGQNYSLIYSPPNGSDRIALAVTPANPNYVYLLTTFNNDFSGLYLSSNSGTYFNIQSSSPNILGYDAYSSGGQGSYDLTIAADPNNAANIFIGGINVWNSVDEGVSWSYSSGYYLHSDQHDIVFFPGSSTSLFVGNDGGIYHSTDGGTTWTDISNNLQIAEMYRLGQSATNPNLILSGWQDNGTSLKNGSSWNKVDGGDGMECIIDYSNNNILYTASQYGWISKSTDGGITNATIASNSGTGINSSGPWVTPYIMHPTNPNTLLLVKDSLYKSTDGGNSWSQLGNTNFGFTSCIAYAKSNPNYIYVVAGYSGVFVSTDGGITFNNQLSGSLSVYATYIAVSNTNPNKAWITYSGYTTDKVYFTNDAGQTWSNYSTGLPAIPANCITYEDGSNDGLYVGTDVGVYYRNSSMTSWVPFNSGLPNVVIDELEIQYTAGKIRAATYGRGMWESPLMPSSLNVSPPSTESSDNHLKVIPNPNSGEFDLVLNINDGSYKIEITNSTGQKIYSDDLKNISNNYKKHFDLHKFGKGVYMITVFNETNTLNKKIIVQ